MKRYDVIISEFAENDINENTYAKKLYFSLKKKILELKDLPDKGRIVPELERYGILIYRELIVDHYRIVYSTHYDSVHILSIVDSRRNLDEILIRKMFVFLNTNVKEKIK